jgi:extradiol dioxygenase family protein
MNQTESVMTRPRFHLAFPVHDLEAARDFYVRLLGGGTGREEPGEWIDFDLYGHQLSAHLAPEQCADVSSTGVDGEAVPLRHFGVVLDWEAWEALAARLKAAGAAFVFEPHVRFVGRPGEQGTFFVRDPSGNALEFKTFRDDAMVFATELDGEGQVAPSA